MPLEVRPLDSVFKIEISILALLGADEVCREAGRLRNNAREKTVAAGKRVIEGFVAKRGAGRDNDADIGLALGARRAKGSTGEW